MNKVNFNELGFNNLRKELEEDLILNFTVKGQDIKIKTTIPTEDKIMLVSSILNNSVDSSASYFNPFRLKIISAVESMEYYSNLDFGEDKFENIYDIYDILEDEGFIDILHTQTDFCSLFSMIEECAKCIVQYNNSLPGLLINMKENSDDSMDTLKNLMEQLKTDPEVKDFVENIMPNLG